MGHTIKVEIPTWRVHISTSLATFGDVDGHDLLIRTSFRNVTLRVLHLISLSLAFIEVPVIMMDISSNNLWLLFFSLVRKLSRYSSPSPATVPVFRISTRLLPFPFLQRSLATVT